MKGLLRKDLYNMQKYLLSLLPLLAVYGAIALLGNNAYFAGGSAALIGVIASIASFSYDKECNWDPYACCLPISRRQQVSARFLLVLLFMLMGMLMSAALSLLFCLLRGGNLADLLLGAVGSGVAGLMLVVLILPAIYRFGVERARLLLVLVGGVFAMPFALSSLIQPEMAAQWLRWLLYALPVLCVLLLVGSWWLCCRIYERKQF